MTRTFPACCPRGRSRLRWPDGTVAASDDTSLDEMWKIDIGSAFSAPPMTFEVNGKQYVAITSGTDPASGKRRRANAPELNEQRNATVLYVFGTVI